MPGTCTRMRSAPWRWIDGSRVPVSSTRRRMISRLCCMRPRVDRRLLGVGQGDDQRVALGARLELAAGAAGDREDRLRGRRAPPAAPPPCRRGSPMRMRSSSGGLSSRRTVPTWSRRSRSRSRSVGPEPLEPLGVDLRGLDLHQHVRAAAQVEPEVDQPRRQPAPARPPRRPAAPASASRRARAPRGRRSPARPGRRRGSAARSGCRAGRPRGSARFFQSGKLQHLRSVSPGGARGRARPALLRPRPARSC